MNYSALIQNRKSVREFTDKQVSGRDLKKIGTYYNKSVRRLVPGLETELHFFWTGDRPGPGGRGGLLQLFGGGTPVFGAAVCQT